MRVFPLLPVLALCACIVSCAAAAEPTLESDDDKMLYALGFAVSQNLAAFDFSETELAKIQAGLADGALGRDSQVPIEEFGPRIDGMLQTRMTKLAEVEREAGGTFRAKMADEEGATTTPSGLVYREIAAGQGANPSPTDTVKLHYHGTLRDGSVFDSSRKRDEPATFRLDQVIGCFSEGVQKMKVGGKSKLTCPPEIAYGDRGSPPKIRPGATLVFEIELLDVVGETSGESVP